MSMAITATVAVTTMVASSLYTQDQANKRADDVQDAQEEARKTDQAIANEKAARERRMQAQKAQQTNATIENMGANTGMSGSSMISNAQSANTTQAGVNTGYINTNQAYGKVQQKDAQAISNAQNQGPSTMETIVGLTGQIAGQYVGGAAGQAGANAAK